MNPMKLISVTAFLAFTATALFASSVTHAQAPTATVSSSLASAEVIAVYPKEKRVLLKHGPIANLGMSDMTMEFGVANPRMLTSFKRGKKIRFSAIMVKDDYIVTHVERAK
jgi:Cu(I)/Ag(I) efflux system periplasmic protein CusF